MPETLTIDEQQPDYRDELVIPDVSHLVTEDDTPVDNIISEKQMRLLTEPLYSSWSGGPQGERRPFAVFANVGLFSSLHEPPLVPDVMLSLDVSVHPDFHEKPHRSYFFWEYGKAPDVAIEIVSNREGNEDGSKLDRYARIGVRYYVIFDPDLWLSEEKLRVYELHARQYLPRADWQLPDTGLSLTLWEGEFEGIREPWLRWCDAAGHLIPTGAERAQQAEERAISAEEKAARLAARLREMGIDPEQV